MSDLLSADPHARGGAQFFLAAQAGFLARQKHIMKDTDGRAQISQFVDVVLHTAGIEDRVGHQGRRHAADGQAIRLDDAVDVIRRLSAAASRHILRNDRRVARNIFLQKWKQRSTPQIAGPSGGDNLHYRDRFAFVKIRLSVSTRDRHANRCCQRRSGKNYFHVKFSYYPARISTTETWRQSPTKARSISRKGRKRARVLSFRPKGESFSYPNSINSVPPRRISRTSVMK